MAAWRTGTFESHSEWKVLRFYWQTCWLGGWILGSEPKEGVKTMNVGAPDGRKWASAGGGGEDRIGRICEWPCRVGGCTGVRVAEVVRVLGLGGRGEYPRHQRLSQRPASPWKSEEAPFLPKGGGVPKAYAESLESAACPRSLSCRGGMGGGEDPTL